MYIISNGMESTVLWRHPNFEVQVIKSRDQDHESKRDP
jgi:hypothetical protein